MENILKKIAEFDKVNETKLAKHEVNLALIDVINAESKKANDIISKVDQLENEFNVAEKKILDIRKQFNSYKAAAKSSTDNLDNELNKLIQQSKDLGIDFNSIPAYKNGKQIYSIISTISKLIDEYNKPI